MTAASLRAATHATPRDPSWIADSRHGSAVAHLATQLFGIPQLVWLEEVDLPSHPRGAAKETITNGPRWGWLVCPFLGDRRARDSAPGPPLVGQKCRGGSLFSFNCDLQTSLIHDEELPGCAGRMNHLISSSWFFAWLGVLMLNKGTYEMPACQMDMSQAEECYARVGDCRDGDEAGL